MSVIQMLSLGLVLVGFIAGSAISERSLKAVDDSTQGLLMRSLAPLRKANLVGIVLVILSALFVPAYALPLLLVYVALSARSERCSDPPGAAAPGPWH
jgi:hypothetical protein